VISYDPTVQKMLSCGILTVNQTCWPRYVQNFSDFRCASSV